MKSDTECMDALPCPWGHEAEVYRTPDEGWCARCSVGCTGGYGLPIKLWNARVYAPNELIRAPEVKKLVRAARELLLCERMDASSACIAALRAALKLFDWVMR